MVDVRREIKAPVASVWGVLSDGWLYPSWVVGASRMRAVDDSWPAVGSELHHSLGGWPVMLNDTTRVVASTPHKELVMRGRGWPMGEVEIQILLEPRPGEHCEVVMKEDVISGPTKLLPYPVRAALIGTRNGETLRRLAYLAEGGSR
ncbi:SRPBCC family protein [Pseudonocardia nigra]|uniref:SRPBCC family protein n=1 Tax=Pseudonocardia nigra TaxID=1921578 RepID=UPI001C5CECF9|nr:SRPBCC family protein [Pseudonocardia nigra]